MPSDLPVTPGLTSHVRQAASVSRLLALARRFGPALGGYAFAKLLTLVLVGGLMRLWQGDSHVPIHYDADTLLEQVSIKAVVEHGWHATNPNLAAPDGQSLEDFPSVDFIIIAVVKSLALLTRDPALLFNGFVLTAFCLTTISSLAVLRQFGVAYPPALVCSLLYSLSPYHFARFEGGHTGLTYYSIVPLSLLVATWIYQGRLFGGKTKPHFGAPQPAACESGRLARRWGVALGVSVLQAGAGIYYAFFAVYFLLVSGVMAGLRRRSVRPLLTAGILMAVTLGTVSVSLVPSLRYWKEHGKNSAVAVREARETEWYAVKLTSLLLPITGHRNHALASLRERYQQQAQLHYEVSTATLGCVASVGFLLLLCVLCRRGRVSSLLESLSLLNVFGFLCGTTGGLGMLFSLLVTPQMRSQSRICVYLSFLALAAIALLLQSVWQRAATTRRRQAVFCGVLVLLLGFGLWDQHPPSSQPNYAQLREHWSQDAQFVAEIEAALPAKAMVFQLPCAKFPEGPGIYGHHSYYATRFYLHSQALRWSGGAMVGRAGDRWQEQISALPLEQQLQAIAAAGFQGIQVSRRGYPDQGEELEARLRQRLGTTPIVSLNNQDSFFRLDPAVAAGVHVAGRQQAEIR